MDYQKVISGLSVGYQWVIRRLSDGYQFHERVGESPGQDENFGTSRSKKSRFVSEIRPFENSEESKSNLPCIF